MKPIIGITTGEIVNLVEPWSPVTYGQSHTYSDAVIQAGGIPLLIPITEDVEVLKEVYERLDGLLLAGGNDINPELYGQTPVSKTKDISDIRDTVEIALVGWALADQKPVLAICRGMQLLNSCLGGTLTQDIATEIMGAQDHTISSRKQDGKYLAHTLKVAESSKLAAIIGSDTIAANSHHHQAIHILAPSLTATAWAEDGIIEAVEATESPFVIGLECHPESLLDTEPKWELVFRSFVQSCQAEIILPQVPKYAH